MNKKYKMIKILTIIGARPQIIKSAALSRCIEKKFSNKIKELLVHTGQHYDDNMSKIFFDELNINKNIDFLNVKPTNQNEMIGDMIKKIEKSIRKNNPDLVLVYGDTNSTLVGSIAASNLRIPLVHIEAGLRSYNYDMPEELNRIYCDYASSMLFCPTENAVKNLKNEGFIHSDKKPYNPNQKGIFLSGDIMLDNAIFYGRIAEKNSKILEKFNLKEENYILLTLHRNYNTSNISRLEIILKSLTDIVTNFNLKLFFPIHPHTQKIINANKTLKNVLMKNKNIIVSQPISFFDMIMIEKKSKIICTDSGGVQKEAFFFAKPCIILRDETEWTELTQHSFAKLAGNSYEKIVDSFNYFNNNKSDYSMPLFGNGNSAEFICEKIISNFE